MHASAPSSRTIPISIGLLVVFAVAAAARLHGIDSTMSLQDSVGPYLSAVRLDGRGHAPAYGVAMLLPYMAAVTVSYTLKGACGVIAVLHAAAAPIAGLLAAGRSRGSVVAAVVVGLLAAFDPGLMDTVRSGAEGYFAPVFVGLAALVPGGFAWVAFAMAVANHPLALAAAPLVCRGDTLTRSSIPGIAVGLLAISHQIAGWGDPGVADGSATVIEALSAFWMTGGVGAAVVLVGPAMAVFHRPTRPLALRVLVAAFALCVAGTLGGYIRDHHLRILCIPAMACWAAAPRVALLLLGAIWLIPAGPPMPPEVHARPGTVGLVDAIGSSLVGRDGDLTVDRMWLSGGPAVEPSAVMLDLWLRGWDAHRFRADGDKVIITAAASDVALEPGFPGTLLSSGHGYTVSVGTTEEVLEWSIGPCAIGGRPGGAWDGLSVFESDVSTQAMGEWWACE